MTEKFNLNDKDVNSKTGVFALVEFLDTMVESVPRDRRVQWLADRGWKFETRSQGKHIYKVWVHPTLSRRGLKLDAAIERTAYTILKTKGLLVPVKH